MPDDGAVQSDFPTTSHAPAIPGPTRLWWVKSLVPCVYVACMLAFVADILHDNPLAYGIAYLPLICTAVVHRKATAVWWLAGLAIVLITIGFFVPAYGRDMVDSLGNRILSILAVLVTAALVRYAREIQERLQAQTARAEAGEELKLEVFNNLSQEIRTPLHAMIGFSELMVANCRPDQRSPLEHMRAGGKRLLRTIDNLIDLTNLDHRTLDHEPVDVVAIARQTMAMLRDQSGQQGLTGCPEVPALRWSPASADAAFAEADSWAARRILENLIANALLHAGPNGSVTICVERTPDGVVASVTDSGCGMATDLVQALNEDASRGNIILSGTGLTLSGRLAEAMGGRLAFESEQGRGTVVRLKLQSFQASR